MMEALQYIVGSLAWSIFGFAAGAYVVTVQREVHEIKAQVVDDDHELDHLGRAPAHHTYRAGGEYFERARQRFGMLILLLALVSLVQITVTAVGYEQQGDCQNRVTREFHEDALTRAAQSSTDWATLRTLLAAVESAPTAGERREALVRANDALAASLPPELDPYIADEC